MEICFKIIKLLLCMATLMSGSSVIELNSSYSCCDPTIKFNPLCDNVFKMADENFAHVDLHKKRCISPCKTIKDDQLILDACLNVTVTTVCTDEVGKIKETSTTYLGQECPQHRLSGTSSPQGSRGLLLLLLLAVIWIVYIF